MSPTKSSKSKESGKEQKDDAKGYDDLDVHILGLERRTLII